MDIQFVPRKQDNYNEHVLGLRKATYGIENLISRSTKSTSLLKKIVIEIGCDQNEHSETHGKTVFCRSTLHNNFSISEAVEAVESLLVTTGLLSFGEIQEVQSDLATIKNLEFPHEFISVSRRTKKTQATIFESVAIDRSTFVLEVTNQEKVVFRESILDSSNPFEIHNTFKTLFVDERHVRILSRDGTIFYETSLKK